VKFAEQIVEEVGEAEPPERTGPVELRESQEKLCEGDVLSAEKVGEVAGGLAGLDEVRVVHESTISREISASPDERGCPGERHPARGSRTPP
jgi:2,4-dienoyl-CoA reductase-like NADH-dependent reductase (Old Yellow Enzyme family)